MSHCQTVQTTRRAAAPRFRYAAGATAATRRTEAWSHTGNPFEELAMSVKSAAAIVSTATAAVLLGFAPTPALAGPVLPSDTGVVETPSTVIPLPPGNVTDCTADPAYRFIRPCMIRKGIAALSPSLG